MLVVLRGCGEASLFLIGYSREQLFENMQRFSRRLTLKKVDVGISFDSGSLQFYARV